METVLPDAMKRIFEEEADKVAYKTVAMQEAKLKTVHELLERELPIPHDLSEEFAEEIGTHQTTKQAQRDAEIEQLVDALAEFMSFDKGPSEEEFIELCNRYLPLMKQHNRFVWVLEYR